MRARAHRSAVFAHWSAQFVAFTVVAGVTVTGLTLIGDLTGMTLLQKTADVCLIAVGCSAFQTWNFFRKTR